MEEKTFPRECAPGFQLFGIGDRPKYVFSDGTLRRLDNGTVVHAWAHGNEASLHPDLLSVRIGGEPVVWEDGEALWWRDGGAPVRLAASSEPVNLPSFAGHPHAPALRTLLAEILFSIDGGLPLPNPLVYRTPWRRDGAMMAMALEATGNLHLVAGWVRSLDDPFDRNNGGREEPDNIGQTLWLLGRCGFGDGHVVRHLVEEAKRRLGPDGALAGTVDGRRHAVYAACWLRLGLEACGLDASWVPVPDEYDDYGPLFWMRPEWVGPKASATTVEYDRRYPYLWWAKAHFHILKDPTGFAGKVLIPSPAPGRPMSWESDASEADYEGIARLSPSWAATRFAAPHTWHASEMFLLAMSMQDASGKVGDDTASTT